MEILLAVLIGVVWGLVLAPSSSIKDVYGDTIKPVAYQLTIERDHYYVFDKDGQRYTLSPTQFHKWYKRW